MGLLSKPDPAPKRMAKGDCGTYLGIALFLGFLYMFVVYFEFPYSVEPKLSFVVRNGTQFVLDGRPFYVNGWNSYWLMDQAVEEKGKPRVSEMFQAGVKLGLTVCRTWAFNDGTYHALQVKLGHYDEQVFQTVLTRNNHMNGIECRDDPTIFAWELINEPHCLSDASGDTLQDWIEEMAGFVKSIDKKHLITVGLEGFYGPTSPPEKLSVNPGEWYNTIGADFIRNNKISAIDFASVHIYPDQWLLEAEIEEKMNYTTKWMTSHIEDGDKERKRPVMATEFGFSNKNKDFDPAQRESFYRFIYDAIYESAKGNGAGSGAFIWQFSVRGMEGYNDDFGIFPGDRPSKDWLIKEQSCRLATLNYGKGWARRGPKDC